MTDKQIIIDGIDVSGCEYYQYDMCTATKDNYGYCSYCCKDYDIKTAISNNSPAKRRNMRS